MPEDATSARRGRKKRPCGGEAGEAGHAASTGACSGTGAGGADASGGNEEEMRGRWDGGKPGRTSYHGLTAALEDDLSGNGHFCLK